MSLGDIKSKLYKKEAEKDLSHHEESQYDPKIGQMASSGDDNPVDLWREEERGLHSEQKKAIRKGTIFLGAVLLIIFMLVIAYFIRKTLFSEDRVVMAVSGQERADSGKLLPALKYEEG